MNTYCSIDLKSFYASVECVLRGLNPLKTHLVVADEERSEKTICLAITPSLKALGISGRPRLFEVKQALKNANNKRIKNVQSYHFVKKSFDCDELKNHLEYEIDCLIAKPRMNTYIDFSSRVYAIYLKYIAPKDIHIYSIDEVFIDLTSYLKGGDPIEFVSQILLEIQTTLGLTATAGVGSNLYLAKVAMDIISKKIIPTKHNLSIGYLDERLYQKKLWDHRPLQDFWRVGKGYAKRLESLGINTMKELAMYAREHEDRLYAVFGVNAELLIDHAWGYESCTMQDIKRYNSKSKSKGIGKVLHKGYAPKEAEEILKELVDHLVLGLISAQKKTNHITLDLLYEHLDPSSNYQGETSIDGYGRKTPKHSHGSIKIDSPTDSLKMITHKALELYERIVKKECLVRKINLTFLTLQAQEAKTTTQEANLFNFAILQDEKKELEKEERLQKARLAIMQKFGKDSVHRGSGMEEKSIALALKSRNGGHNG